MRPCNPPNDADFARPSSKGWPRKEGLSLTAEHGRSRDRRHPPPRFKADLACYQPRFIIDQVLASCKFEGIKPQFTPQNTEDALANLFIQSHSKSKMGVMR